jgi:hypothetical protein
MHHNRPSRAGSGPAVQGVLHGSTAGSPQSADSPADARRGRVGPIPDSCTAQKSRRLSGSILVVADPGIILFDVSDPRVQTVILLDVS